MSSASSSPSPLNQPRKRACRVLRTAGWLIGLALLAVTLFGFGFLWFVSRLQGAEIALPDKADGIVVLTGGASRIEDAIDLLARRRGQRLLISGVNPATSEREIARLRPEHEKIIACCVDLDWTAVNTVTNATETRRWVRDRGFQSLIVVTSNYHMPRAMAELSNQLPGTQLIAFPVVSEQMRAGWGNSATLRLLFLEYVKYIAAVVRINVRVIDRIVT